MQDIALKFIKSVILFVVVIGVTYLLVWASDLNVNERGLTMAGAAILLSGPGATWKRQKTTGCKPDVVIRSAHRTDSQTLGDKAENY